MDCLRSPTIKIEGSCSSPVPTPLGLLGGNDFLHQAGAFAPGLDERTDEPPLHFVRVLKFVDEEMVIARFESKTTLSEFTTLLQQLHRVLQNIRKVEPSAVGLLCCEAKPKLSRRVEPKTGRRFGPCLRTNSGKCLGFAVPAPGLDPDVAHSRVHWRRPISDSSSSVCVLAPSWRSRNTSPLPRCRRRKWCPDYCRVSVRTRMRESPRCRRFRRRMAGRLEGTFSRPCSPPKREARERATRASDWGSELVRGRIFCT